MKIKVLAEPQSLREALEEKQSLASSIERCWYSLCSLACGPTTDSVVASGVTLPSLLVPEISSAHLPLQDTCDYVYFQLPGSRMISPSQGIFF